MIDTAFLLFQAKFRTSDPQAVAHISHILINHFLSCNTIFAFFCVFPRKKETALEAIKVTLLSHKYMISFITTVFDLVE